LRRKLFFALLFLWIVGVIALLYLYWYLWTRVFA
jgi:hypothetical protein